MLGFLKRIPYFFALSAVTFLNAHAESPKLSSEEARSVVELFESKANSLRLEHQKSTKQLGIRAEERYTALLKGLVDKLTAIQEVVTKSGDLDAAIEVRDAVRHYEKLKPSDLFESEKEDNTRYSVGDLRKKIRFLEKKLAAYEKRRMRIPKEAIEWSRHSYLRIDEPTTYRFALRQAEALGGHLARVENAEEQAFIAQLIRQGKHRFYFIEGNDELSEGDWRWENGQPIKHLDWGPNEPDSKRIPAENGLAMNRDTGRMDDFPPGLRQGYVIEWER